MRNIKIHKTFYLITMMALVVMLSLICGFTKKSTNAESTDNFTFENGAYIRLDTSEEGTTGIRFVANLDSSLYDSLIDGNQLRDGAELGMIIVPESYIEDFEIAQAEDYFTYFNEVKGKAKQDISVQFDVDKIIPDGYGYKINGAIVKIKPANINRNYQPIAYYTLSGTTYYKVATFSRSIVDVVNSAFMQDGDNFTSEQLSVLTGIVESASDGITLDLGTKKSVRLADELKIQDNNAIYEVENDAICTISEGVITAVSEGETTVTVTAFNSQFSKTYSVTVTDNRTQLSVPTNVAINGTVVSWDSIENADCYLVNINGTDYDASTNSYDFTSLELDTDVFVKVCAKNSAESFFTSEYSEEVGAKVLGAGKIATFNSSLYENDFIDKSNNGDFGGGSIPWTSAPTDIAYLPQEGNGGSVYVALAESAKSNVNGLFIKLDNKLDLVNNAGITIRFKISYVAVYEDLYVQFGDTTCLNGDSWNKNGDAVLVVKDTWQTLTLSSEKLLSKVYGYTANSDELALVFRRGSELYVGAMAIYIDSLEYL